MGGFAALKSLDIYPKIHDDMKKKTLSGAIVSLIGAAFIVYLIISEVAYYLSHDTVDHLYVDTSSGEKIQIHMDVTFPKVPCSLLSLDAMDVSGSHQTDVYHHIIKTRLDSDGKPAGSVEKLNLGGKLDETKVIKEAGGPDKEAQEGDAPTAEDDKKDDDTKEDEECQTCYGAETDKFPCCNTCADVKEAYHQRGWNIPNLADISQCKGETDQINAALQHGEGCQVAGYLEVNKVAGNFHFAPGSSFGGTHGHANDLVAFAAGQFDVSHTINSLSFGEKYPGQKNPLDLQTKAQTDKAGTIFQYYVKVVPTRFTDLSGEVINTNQFSVTDHETKVEKKHGRGLPGLFFFYDVSPIKVEFTESQKSFAHFLTQLCAIIGGVFTVTGMVDKLVYHGLKSVGHKIDLGKQT